ncbi:hypothetical protein Tco_0954349 [Tanacetum coccineum]|uniref:Uncharacterized protein n=1 Tax=Tanacetum coccineum TaxID=301880 RepID=A0ABQ5E374_9ASTR
MDDPTITIEEYIRLEEVKAQRHGRTFNWQTATFGKVKYYEDEDDCFTDFETEFPAIVFDNTLTFDIALPCEPTVSPPSENKIDFRISLDESDDEDYTVIFDENSFSYKIIYVNDLNTDSENDGGKNNMPSSPKPTVNYLDDLDCFNDFENEFSAIVYNDGLTSKPYLKIEPPISSKHVSKSETSLSEYDEKERNTLHFGDSFPLDVTFPDNLKTIKDIDDYIFITQPFRYMAPLPAADQRHPWLRYQVEGYTEDLEGLTLEMRQDFAVRLRIVYTGGEGQQVFVSYAWRRLFRIRSPLVCEFILEFLSTCRISDTEMGLDVAYTLCFQLGGVRRRMTWRQFILALVLHTEQEMAEAGFGAYWDGSERLIPDKGDLRDYWVKISSDRDFLGTAPSYVLIRDLVRRLCHRMIAYNISGRGQAPEKVTGINLLYLRSIDRGTTNVLHLFMQYLFIGRLAMHFGLLGRLNIYSRYCGTWAWVASGPERQQGVAAGAHEADKAGPTIDEGAQEAYEELSRALLQNSLESPPG